MMSIPLQSLPIEEFLSIQSPIIDVRSPAEYAKGHIPGACSIPLFTDEQRAQVGTCYKRQGQQAAILLGLELLGPRLHLFAQELLSLHAFDAPLRIYCWRGGMRSASVGWLSSLFSLRTVTLKKGYKAFRNWAQTQFSRALTLRMLVGMTGVGKTELLIQLEKEGQQVLDLERIANHRGSAYGYCGEQPTQEHFENLLAVQMARYDLSRPVWIEGESRLVGRCCIPNDLYTTMRAAQEIEVVVEYSERLQRLLGMYASFPKNQLITATQMIARRLGNVRTAQAVEAIADNRLSDALRVILDYYDRTYRHSLGHLPQSISVPIIRLYFPESSSVQERTAKLQQESSK